MECPKCHAVMEPVTYADIEVDRCTKCGGIWLDMLEDEELLKAAGAEKVDTGDAAMGKKMNQVDQIDCPVCAAPMIRMVHPTQHHIWYEGCHVCYGKFLDAGELRDMQEATVADLLRDLATQERR